MRLFLSLALVIFILGCEEKPGDRFVTINGKKQHILDLGTGSPAVIFVSGFGDDLSVYRRVQGEIAKTSRTLSYDRSGLGKSEILDTVRSLDLLTQELSQIMAREDISGKCILVGHSYGGFIVRYFAQQYPESVGALLLVDPSVEFMEDELRRIKTRRQREQYDSLYQHGRDPSWSEGVNREADYYRENSEKMKTIQFRPDIPVTVLTALNMPALTHDFLQGANEIKVELHKRWKQQNPWIKHVMTRISGHYIQLEEPVLVIKEIQTLIDTVKSSKK
jgi:pimeloyl-ACP methyl ester carboxylesterase